MTSWVLHLLPEIDIHLPTERNDGSWDWSANAFWLNYEYSGYGRTQWRAIAIAVWGVFWIALLGFDRSWRIRFWFRELVKGH